MYLVTNPAYLNMTSLPLLLLLLLSVSLHACTPRPLTKIDTANLKEVILGAASGSSIQTDSPSFLAAKDERGQARSMLGPAGHHVEEAMDTNTDGTAEDIGEMDYAQPTGNHPFTMKNPDSHHSTACFIDSQ